jgi:hypothetical protein
MSGFFFKLHAPVDFHPKVVFSSFIPQPICRKQLSYIRKIYHTFLTLCRFSRLSHPLVSQQSHFKRSEVLVGNLWVFMLDRVQRILS